MLPGPISEIVPLFSHAEALSRYGTTVCMQAIISVDRICVEAWGSGVRVRFFRSLGACGIVRVLVSTTVFVVASCLFE